MQKRTVIEIGLCMLMGVVLWYGIWVLRGDSYYAVSLAIMLTGLIGFFLLFENGKPGVALLTVMAALCGVAVVSRIAFFFLCLPPSRDLSPDEKELFPLLSRLLL